MSMCVTPSSIKIPYYTTYYPASNYTDFFSNHHLASSLSIDLKFIQFSFRTDYSDLKIKVTAGPENKIVGIFVSIQCQRN